MKRPCQPPVTVLVAGVLLLCLGTTAHADKDAKEPAPITDADFVAQVTTLSRIDVRYSELAAKQAGSDKVKEFADKMAKEQNRRADKLADVARDLKAGLNYEKMNEAKATLARLAKLEGAAFDREYVKLLVADQEATLALFEREVKSGTAPEIKAFATDGLKALKDQLKDARDVSDGIK